MEEKYMYQIEMFMTKQLRTLVGYTVVDAAFSRDSEMEGMLYPGLRMRNKDGKEAIVWFLRDEEDNGAGHYDIQFIESDSKKVDQLFNQVLGDSLDKLFPDSK